MSQRITNLYGSYDLDLGEPERLYQQERRGALPVLMFSLAAFWLPLKDLFLDLECFSAACEHC